MCRMFGVLLGFNLWIISWLLITIDVGNDAATEIGSVTKAKFRILEGGATGRNDHVTRGVDIRKLQKAESARRAFIIKEAPKSSSSSRQPFTDSRNSADRNKAFSSRLKELGFHRNNVDPGDTALCSCWDDESQEPCPASGIGEGRETADTAKYVPAWQVYLKKHGTLGLVDDVSRVKEYCLTEVLQVRIYEEDKANWTLRELKQWMHYLFLNGVQHIYLCDHYASDEERLESHVVEYISRGLVTYIPWGPKENISSNPLDAQIQCYNHTVATYGNDSKWQLAVDMDEYPFVRGDREEGALLRMLQRLTNELGAALSEVCMENYLMLGKGDNNNDMVISRINRVVREPQNSLVKPIYRPDRVSKAAVHHNYYTKGNIHWTNPRQLIMLHYWGARLQDWGPDTPEIRNKTVEMNLMRVAWGEKVRNSLLAFGENDAFSKSSGP